MVKKFLSVFVGLCLTGSVLVIPASVGAQEAGERTEPLVTDDADLLLPVDEPVVPATPDEREPNLESGRVPDVVTGEEDFFE